jgi:large exoprotein involved in heme utilization and adhesion
MVRHGARHGHETTPGETPEPPSLAKRLQAVLRSPLPRSHKYVLLALLAYARPDLTVYHAQSQLAAELDYSETYIREILTHLTACRILEVLGAPRQHYATEYAIDLGHLPDRPTGPWRKRDRAALADASGQSETQLPAEQGGTGLPPHQGITQLPLEHNSVAPRGQLSEPQSNQRNTQEKKPFDKGVRHARPARSAVPRSGPRVPAPEVLPITEELRQWIAAHVPGLLELSGVDLALEVQRCLQYHRAHQPTVRYPLAQWYEVVKLRLLWLYQQARARGKLNPSASVAVAPASPDGLPSYLRPPPSGDDCMPIEQVHALVADFLGPRTLTGPRTQGDRLQRESPRQGTPGTPAAARDAPTQARGQMLARSRAAAILAHGAFITTDSLGAGRARDLRITAGGLSLTDGSIIGSRPFASASGAGGNVTLKAGTLTLTGGAQISTSTSGMGHSGELSVAASDMIAIAGPGSGLFSNTFASGDAGRLSIDTPLLTMDAGLIQALAAKDSRGNAGGIDVRVGRLALSGGAQLDSSTRSTGRGGKLAVVATDTIAISGRDSQGFPSGLFSGTFGSEVSSAEGSGDAGGLSISAPRLTLSGGAQISSSARGPGRGGELTVTATDAIAIAGPGSGLFSNAFGSGDGGRLSLATPLLTMDAGLIQTGGALGSFGNAGNLEVRVGRLTLTGGAQINATARGSGRGGELTVTAADAITISGRDSQGTRSGLFSGTFGSGDAGRLSLATPLLTLSGGAQISTTAQGSGRGGELTVMATDAIAITGQGSGLFSNAFSLGDGGRLSISTPLLTMDDGLIQTGGASGSLGNAGNLEVRVGRLTLTGGAQLDSSAAGRGRGGELTVAASEGISITGQGSGLFSDTSGSGDAGSLFVATPTLRLEDQGRITAIAFGAGNGGDIALSAGRMTLTGGARVDSGSVGRGRGGAVTLRAEDLQLTDGAVIAASSSGDGDAGTIRIQASERFRSQQGSVAATAARAGGGTIEVHAGRLVQLLDSELTTSIRGGGADAGNLTINAPFVVIAGSQSIANAFEGRGGNLAIAAEVLLADPSSRLAASGSLEITGAVTPLTGTLAPLPQTFMDVATLLPVRCTARFSGGKASSLVLGGRDGLPADPSGVLPSPLTRGERLRADPAVTEGPQQQKSSAKFALLAGHEKALPRLQGGRLVGGCPK